MELFLLHYLKPHLACLHVGSTTKLCLNIRSSCMLARLTLFLLLCK
jgi:hypothetical protein